MTTPELRDRTAYFPDADTVVCADLHLGRDRESNVELPLGERRRIPRRIETLLDQFRPARLVVAGDVLHAFDDVDDSVTESLAAVETAAADADVEPIFVAGNHDGMLETVAEAAVVDSYDLGTGTVVVHGDEQPSSLDAERYVIGHEHPAIVIEGRRHACYLEGPAPDAGASVFVLPAFNRLARGTVLNGAASGDPASPLVQDVDRFRPAVRDPEAEETLWFPPFAELQPLL
ncbi:metallophosphoesterase [Salinarchaeum chitinilyticum]